MKFWRDKQIWGRNARPSDELIDLVSVYISTHWKPSTLNNAVRYVFGLLSRMDDTDLFVQDWRFLDRIFFPEDDNCSVASSDDDDVEDDEVEICDDREQKEILIKNQETVFSNDSTNVASSMVLVRPFRPPPGLEDVVPLRSMDSFSFMNLAVRDTDAENVDVSASNFFNYYGAAAAVDTLPLDNKLRNFSIDTTISKSSSATVVKDSVSEDGDQTPIPFASNINVCVPASSSSSSVRQSFAMSSPNDNPVKEVIDDDVATKRREKKDSKLSYLDILLRTGKSDVCKTSTNGSVDFSPAEPARVDFSMVDDFPQLGQICAEKVKVGSGSAQSSSSTGKIEVPIDASEQSACNNTNNSHHLLQIPAPIVDPVVRALSPQFGLPGQDSSSGHKVLGKKCILRLIQNE